MFSLFFEHFLVSLEHRGPPETNVKFYFLILNSVFILMNKKRE